jgi:hypothetical protein
MLRRNTASQVIYLPALQLTADGTAVTSGAALTVAKDGTEAAAAGSLTHSANGVWKYAPTQAETDAAIVALILTYSGATPVVLNLVTTGADTSAVALGANTTAPANATIASIYALLQLTDADVALIKADVTTLLGRITATLFSGITSLGDWLRRLARKDAGTAGMVTAEAEINTGGTATFAGATDSLEGNRDKALLLKGSLNETQAFDLLLAAAAGETSQTDDAETFKFLDGTDAFVTTFDESGNRADVALQ